MRFFLFILFLAAITYGIIRFIKHRLRVGKARIEKFDNDEGERADKKIKTIMKK